MMQLRFGYTNTRLTEKYTGKDDSRERLARWTKAWGEIPQPEWAHIHTLDVIPKNWYLETELLHETADQDEMKESFLLTFSFEDRFACIDEALQEIKTTIF